MGITPKESPYSDGRLQDLDIASLRRIRERVQTELHQRGLSEIQRLEDEANALREQLGLKRRQPLRKERPIKG